MWKSDLLSFRLDVDQKFLCTLSQWSLKLNLRSLIAQKQLVIKLLAASEHCCITVHKIYSSLWESFSKLTKFIIIPRIQKMKLIVYTTGLSCIITCFSRIQASSNCIWKHCVYLHKNMPILLKFSFDYFHEISYLFDFNIKLHVILHH